MYMYIQIKTYIYTYIHILYRPSGCSPISIYLSNQSSLPLSLSPLTLSRSPSLLSRSPSLLLLSPALPLSSYSLPLSLSLSVAHSSGLKHTLSLSPSLPLSLARPLARSQGNAQRVQAGNISSATLRYAYY